MLLLLAVSNLPLVTVSYLLSGWTDSQAYHVFLADDA